MAMINAARTKSAAPRFTSWSASRLDDYDRCPYYARLKHLDKLCTICFAGKLMTPRGMPFGTPQVCTKCGKTPEKGDALTRGGVIGDRLDLYLLGKDKTPGATILHPKVKTIVAASKTEIKRGEGAVQVNLRFTSSWELIEGDGYDPRAWVYTKLDYRWKKGPAAAVIDWKTGGVDKRTGEVKVAGKYDDQLLTYCVALLSADPEVQEVRSSLVFLDAKPPHDPVLERPGLVRKDLKKAQAKLTKKVLPMFNDTTFAPRSQFLCDYCDYAKAKGGPCKF